MDTATAPSVDYFRVWASPGVGTAGCTLRIRHFRDASPTDFRTEVFCWCCLRSWSPMHLVVALEYHGEDHHLCHACARLQTEKARPMLMVQLKEHIAAIAKDVAFVDANMKARGAGDLGSNGAIVAFYADLIASGYRISDHDAHVVHATPPLEWDRAFVAEWHDEPAANVADEVAS